MKLKIRPRHAIYDSNALPLGNVSENHPQDPPQMSPFAKTPEPPYYAVIFTSQRTESENDYELMAERMVELAAEQAGFLGAESARGNDGFGITVSYWKSLEAISSWKQHSEHRIAQEAGKSLWYQDYQLRISKVERAYSK